MQVRRVAEADISDVVDFAIGGMRLELYPDLVFDREKLVAIVRAIAADDAQFNLAAFDDDGHPVAVVAAVVNPMMWFERSEAIVVMCRSIVPWQGSKLVGYMIDWANDNPAIRQIVFPLEFHASPQQADVLQRRYRFKRSHQVVTWVKE